jgi:hypothetical protein
MTSAEIAARLHAAVDEGERLFAPIDETGSARRADAGGWCAREVVGHLIDSACNNHRRFVVGQSSPSLVFDGYDGDEWVRLQHYAQVPWRDLVQLWTAYNRHLERVIASAGDDVVARPKLPHNYDQILGEQYAPDQPQTLGALMLDYIEHMRHHFEQVRRVSAV